MALPNTRRSAKERRAVMAGVGRLFFLGIGGVHMWALAMLAVARGYAVAGMDRVKTARTERLRAAGIAVYDDGADAMAALEAADAVVYTLAVSAENALYRRAVARGIPLFSRADFLGYLMDDSPVRIGVSGCHGKSTVTAMLGEMLAAAGRDPTVLCGADMRATGSSFMAGEGAVFLAEACEYADSFLSLSPTLAVVLNVGFDHPDYFADGAAVAASFARFAGGAETVLTNADDESAMAATAGVSGRRFCFGLSPAADFRGENLTFSGGTGRFSLILAGQSPVEVSLRVAGMHNVYNALAAAGAAALCGLSAAEIKRGLESFVGAARRFEYKGRLCGARVYDDYAHHPQEIAATLKTAREAAGARGRLLAVFQPHTYTRTAALWADFCEALRLADRVFLTDIYAAREVPIENVTGLHLAEAVGERATHHNGFSALAAAILAELRPDDLLVVMGAGDVDGLFREFSEKDFTI